MTSFAIVLKRNVWNKKKDDDDDGEEKGAEYFGWKYSYANMKSYLAS